MDVASHRYFITSPARCSSPGQRRTGDVYGTSPTSRLILPWHNASTARHAAWRHPVPHGRSAAPQRRGTTFLSCSSPIYSGSAETTSDERSQAEGARHRSSPFRCHWSSAFPGKTGIATRNPSQEAVAASSTRGVRYVVETVPLPVTAFVVASCPAPPVGTQTTARLPCRFVARSDLGSRLDRPTPTCSTLPDIGFSITRLTCRKSASQLHTEQPLADFWRQAPDYESGRRSPSQVSHDLRAQRSRRLSDVTRKSPAVCPSSRPSKVCTRRCVISGGRR